jgi:hypothetical protein
MSVNFLSSNNFNLFKKYLNSLSYVNKKNINDKINFYIKNNIKILNSNAKEILIKGEVQSGKTNNIIFLINEFIYQKIKYFIYLTGSLNELNFQNLIRLKNAFKIINKKVVFINARNKDINSFLIKTLDQQKNIIIFTGIKNKEYFENTINSIENSSEKKEKIIIFDDEADIFTLSKSFLNFRKKMKNKIYIKYISITATPYKNLYFFQNIYDFFHIYKSPKKYVGLKHFLNNKKIIFQKKFSKKNVVLISLI